VVALADGAQDQATLMNDKVASAHNRTDARPTQALLEAQQALAANPNDQDLLLRVAWMHYQIGELDAAQATVERMLLLQTDDVEALGLRWDIWAAQGRTAEVREAIIAFKKTATDAVGAALLEIGMLWGSLGQPGEAQEALRQLTATHPTDTRVVELNAALAEARRQAFAAK
jgi:tetratricopeptide (TPR) repeat protein